MRARAGARGCPDPRRAGFAAERRGPVLIPGLLDGSLGEPDQMALGISEHRKRQVVRRDLCRWDHLLAAELLRLGEVSLGIAHLHVERDVAWPPVRAPADPATDAALGRSHEAVVHRHVAVVDLPIEVLPVEAARLCPVSADDFEPNCWVCQYRYLLQFT